MASSRLVRLIIAALLGLTFGTASCATTTVPPASRSPVVNPNYDLGRPTKHTASHTATLLHDGRVLLLGGSAVAEIADPGARAWTPMSPMPFAGTASRTFVLADGRVFVDGRDGFKLYDPTTDTWVDPSPPPREQASVAALLSDGRVLVTPGSPPNERRSSPVEGRFPVEAATYDPTTDRWASGGEMHWETWPPPRGSGPTSFTRLLDGRVLAIYPQAAELYDPTTNSWSEAAPLPKRARGHRAALLPSGDVLVVGGTPSRDLYDTWNISRRAYRYVPGRNAWVQAPDMRAQRFAPELTSLPNGQVLVWGGYSSTERGVEIYSPPPAEAWYAAADMPYPFYYLASTATVLNSGLVLFVGRDRTTPHARPEAPHVAVYDPQADRWR